ncbi:hypothetical protein GYMLUDRAFT_135520, partial [Collybiopsis luxurians FD-317 M1]
EELGKLPTTLNDTYKHILDNIHISHKQHTLHIFECLAYAKHPLSPWELAEVFTVKFKPNGDAVLLPNFHVSKAEDEILKTCSTLIQIVDGSEKHLSRIVEFAHLSIKEYLHSDEAKEGYQIRPSRGHATLAKLCISSLMYSSDLMTLPLGVYVIDYWLDHEALNKILDPQSPEKFIHWRNMAVHGRRYNQNVQALYCAAALGQSKAVQKWLAGFPGVVDLQGGLLGTPLCAASCYGRMEVIQILLGYNASVQGQGGRNWTPLHYAASNGHIEVTHLLLQHNAAVNAPQGDNATPLFITAQNGHLEVVHLLLEHNAAVDAPKKNNATPLFIAAQEGHLEVAHLLLE